MYKAYKFRIYPNETQKILLHKSFGCVRFIYNYYLSRKEKESKNYYKCKKKINVLYTKLKNARKYYLHKVTKEITDRYDIIISETLKTKQMIERKKLSKEITDASFFEIIRPKNNKSEEKGKREKILSDK